MELTLFLQSFGGFYLGKMGQEEVMEVLKKSDKPLARIEIAKILKVNPSRVSSALKKMIKYNEVDFIEINRKIAKERFNCVKRVRLYFKL